MPVNTQRNVFIIGHKNPDTDSICSAIAFADIKNRTDPRHYIPRRAGQINEETKYVLKRFNAELPAYTGDIGTQVKDMEIRRSPKVTKDCSIRDAWKIMHDNSLVTLPVRTDDDRLEGIVTFGDIARVYMESSVNPYLLSESRAFYGALADTIKGEIIVGDANSRLERGKVLIGSAKPEIMQQDIEEGDIIITARENRQPVAALESGAGCVILCLKANASDEVISLAKKTGSVVIKCELDTYSVAMLLTQSVPLSHIMRTEGLVTFRTEDYTDDIKETMVNNKHRAFPVINKKGKCIGTISRRNFLGITKKDVILVDHNEINQAVDNIQAANILQIVDHHRLGDIQTIQPVLFRNEPVGCTATILYSIYQEEHLEISPQIAGLLLSAIISDTLMFRSPTCTISDKMAAGALSLIAGVDIGSLAKEMFSAGSDLKNKSPEEIFYQDYKKFTTSSLVFGIGQISSMSESELGKIKERLQSFIKQECERSEVSQVYFMLTNILEESTELLYCGDGCELLLGEAFNIKPEGGSCVLKGIVSRKKQLVPKLLDVLTEG